MRVDIKAILADPKLRKELLDRAARFIIQFERDCENFNKEDKDHEGRKRPVD